ncbi:hypothetical protein R1sor_020654 [Riccia sorocarpa]|uniref:Uncharacterized protein n=1 Tax=Riccia sorocarpa TaxID=122646 RepID=A0ABD3GES8_9MARC
MSSILQEQLWQAGKKGITTIVVLTFLPILVPLLFILSVFLFTSGLPLLSGIGLVFYLQKHATVLMPYHLVKNSTETKLEVTPSLGSAAAETKPDVTPSVGPAMIPRTFGGFSGDEVESIDACEEVDPEFDAVLVDHTFRSAELQSSSKEFDSGLKKSKADLEREKGHLKVSSTEATVMEEKVGDEQKENRRKNGMEGVTSENLATEEGGSYLNLFTSSGPGPESMTLDYSPLEMFQSDDDSSVSEEEGYKTTPHDEFSASSSESGIGTRSFPFEGFSGLRSSGSRPSSEERSRRATDMYESEEQLHLQQFSWLLQYWRRKEFQAGPHALGQAKLRNELRLLRKGHDEEK